MEISKRVCTKKQEYSSEQDYHYFFRKGNYQAARKSLESFEDKSSPLYFMKKGKLEVAEYNFNEAKSDINKLLSFKNFQKKALFTLSTIHINLGDVDIAKLMIDTLLEDEDYYISSIFLKIYLLIYEKNFYEAYDALNKINISKLSETQKEYYISLDVYLRYFLGMISKEEAENICKYQRYLLRQIVNPSQGKLLKHITPHFISSENENGFLGNIQIKKIIEKINYSKETQNPILSNFSNIYKLKHSSQVGVIDGIPTNGICAATLPTGNIITLYPLLFSHEFDKEGFAKSKELKFKRIKGGL